MDRRRQLTLRRRWESPEFVANDGGTLSIAFLPDGRLYDGPLERQPHARETLPVVLHGAPWSRFDDCRAVR